MSETVLNQRYRLDEQIGEGGMAVVYRGQDLLLNRHVAIKILRPQYAADASFLKRFEREAQAAAGFSHPNIVNVYDVGADRNQHYIVMEYIRGPSLKDLIRRQGPFSVDGAIYIIGQVASALEYAHQRDLIHRDIKPQNILVDREGNAKVVDFGIAKGVRDASLTDAGTGMGTVHYVSPEQARGEPATPASDLYATGVVLFEMLTKRLPFEADTPIGVAMLHVNQPPPSPRQFNPAIPPQVEAIILRALAKDPSERFASAGAFANALRHWDAPEPVRAETALLPAPPAPPRREPAVAPHVSVGRQPTAPARREQPVAPPLVPTRPPAVTGSGRGLPPRSSAPRDDLGCATWLVGAAILIAIVGLLLLAFRVLPGWLDDDADGGRVGLTIPTPTTAPPTATSAATATSPIVASVPTIGAAASPTARADAPSPTRTALLEPVPDLIGETVLDAESLLGGRWTLVSEEAYSDVYSAGVIIAQNPDAGVGLAAGESVSVVVSLGPQYVVVPTVTWLTLDEAAAELMAAGFDYVVRDEPSVDYPAGVAMWTEPLDFAAPGSTVTLVMSMGDVVLVPDVYGLDEFTATSELNAAGLLVGEIYYSGCDTIVGINSSFDCATFPDGGVAIMSATPLIYVERGVSVDLVIYSADL